MLLLYLMLSSKTNSYAISIPKPGLVKSGELMDITPLAHTFESCQKSINTVSLELCEF